MADACLLSLLDTLELAKREFVFIGGCVVTDRPDLPLSPDTSWTPDFSRLVAAIDDAVDQLVGADRRWRGRDCCAEGCIRSKVFQKTARKESKPRTHGG